jgi:hypothetical protein
LQLGLRGVAAQPETRVKSPTEFSMHGAEVKKSATAKHQNEISDNPK